jgi:hypothetical protein
MPPDTQRVQEAFLASASCHDPADRAAILDRECLADCELRLRVEALLKAHDHISDYIIQPRVGSDDRDKPWLA